jgi:preprotein translocase subunit SecD
MRGHLSWLVVILLLTVFAVWTSLPDTKISNVDASCYKDTTNTPKQGIHISFDGSCKEDISLNVTQSLGLDLVGGLRVLLQAELPAGSFTVDNLRDTANNVEKRVDALGVGSATVQLQGSNRILVELPGVRDPQQAIDTIQKTALLEFVDFSGLAGQASQLAGRKILTDKQLEIQQQRAAAEAENKAKLEGTAEPTAEATQAAAEATAEATAQPADSTAPPVTPEPPPLTNPQTGKPFNTIMTGAGLQAAAAHQDQSGQWVIQFDLTSDAEGLKFGPFTAAHVGQPMAIVLDGVVLSSPTINSKLETGGVISGRFTEAEAKQLALQLRSGALPIPLRVESAETVGATLGQESVNLSVRAGVIGVIVVLAFMLVNYRVPGIAASLALLVFIVLNLAIFKLLPVTLTLPAIVGFLISIGTAVDGNILIFERMREELRAGKDVDTAVDEGFARAWTSIRDSNLSTIIISLILFFFGQTPGASIVSGFAVTLILGLVLNLFTAIIVTRTFLHLILFVARRPMAERTWLMGV